MKHNTNRRRFYLGIIIIKTKTKNEENFKLSIINKKANHIWRISDVSTHNSSAAIFDTNPTRLMSLELPYDTT